MTPTTAFFGRRAKVLVQRSGTVLPDAGPGDVTGVTSGTSKLFTAAAYPLRIQFKIEKQIGTPPNTADIIVTNLRKETRRQIQAFGAATELHAGYAGLPLQADPKLSLLFKGQARTVDNVRQGGEWLTHIQCGDGEVPFRIAYVMYSARPGTATKDIVVALAEQLGASGVVVKGFIDQVNADVIPMVKEEFAKGYAVQGPALNEIQKLLTTETLLSIQNGELQAVPLGASTRREVVSISAKSGMIGSPEHGTPDQNEQPSVLKVASALLPRLLPGDPFVVDGENIQGVFRAEKVTHTGDTHSGDWKTEIEGRELAGARVL